MDFKEAIEERHSVRKYLNKDIDAYIMEEIYALIDKMNQKSGLHFVVVENNPESFQSFLKYGYFENVKNYIAIYAKNEKDVEVKAGYYGEEIVLTLQTMGLNTCWVAGTYNKKYAKSLKGEDEKLISIIVFGIGADKGKARKSKKIEQVCKIDSNTPYWVVEGVRCALLAPTAINQQRFKISYNDEGGIIHPLVGALTKLDAGIVQYHFEVGSGKKAIVE